MASVNPKIKNRFVVSHAADSAFTRHDFRPHLQMRDLGVRAATDGAVNIYVTRVTESYNKDHEPGMHYHLPDFQYFYVLKGWQKMYFEGHGEMVMKVGSGWLQERELKHVVLDHSADFEILVINMPASFETVQL